MKSTTGYSWLELILGVLLLMLGIYTIFRPDVSFGAVVIVYGIVALITGIVDIALYISLNRRTGLGPVMTLIAGIFSILAGILILFNLNAGAWALTILFPIWFIAHCIAQLCNLGATKLFGGTAAYVVTIITCILGIILGIMILFDPWASAVSLVYFVGFYLLLLGIDAIVMAISRLTHSKRST